MDPGSSDKNPRGDSSTSSALNEPRGLLVDDSPTKPKAAMSTVGRHDVQIIFALTAISILIFGLLPLASELLSSPAKSTANTAPLTSPIFIVDINSASAAELSLLPQVGPVLAQRIVAERTAGGPFQTVDDLSRTPGVGADRIHRLRPLIVAKRPVSESHQATYRAAKIPTDDNQADLIIAPHSDLIFMRPAPTR